MKNLHIFATILFYLGFANACSEADKNGQNRTKTPIAASATATAPADTIEKTESVTKVNLASDSGTTQTVEIDTKNMDAGPEVPANTATVQKSTAPAIEDKEKITKEMLGQMVQLLAFRTNYELKVGEKAYYAGAEHGSVGEQVNVWADNTGAVKMYKKSFEYDNADYDGTPGGDAGYEFYFFEAIQPGVTTITIEESFRGEVKETYELKIAVVE